MLIHPLCDLRRVDVLSFCRIEGLFEHTPEFDDFQHLVLRRVEVGRTASVYRIELMR